MLLQEKLGAFNRKTWRLRRHMNAMVRYQTPRRLWNLALVEYERITKRERVKGRPYILVVDPLNTCNLRCPLCPTGRGDLPLKPGRMRHEQFQDLIKQVAPHTFKLIMYNWGEPFLHKEILEMISCAHKNRISTVVSSNLNVLPKGGGEAVVRSGLDDLIISCDGLTQEVYEKYRRNGTLENVVNNLKEIAEAKKRLRSRTPTIEFQFLVFRHNEHQAPHVEKFAKDLGANFVRLTSPYVDESNEEFQVAINPEYVRPQYQGEPEEDPHKLDIFHPEADADACAEKYPGPVSCFWPWRSMVINWSGAVDPCCGKNYLENFGNVFEQSVDEIWNGEAYRYARRWIAGTANGEEPKKIVCRGCRGYQ